MRISRSAVEAAHLGSHGIVAAFAYQQQRDEILIENFGELPLVVGDVEDLEVESVDEVALIILVHIHGRPKELA